MSVFNWVKNALRICYPTKKRQKGNVKAWETLSVHWGAFIPGCNYYTMFESERWCLWVRPRFVPFIARQNKRLEKEGAPPAARGFPRHPPPSTPNLPLEGETPPKVRAAIPSGGGAPGRTRLELGHRNIPRAPAVRRGGRHSNRCTARRIGGVGERGERRAWGQPHPRAGTGLQGRRYEGMKEMREEEHTF